MYVSANVLSSLVRALSPCLHQTTRGRGRTPPVCDLTPNSISICLEFRSRISNFSKKLWTKPRILNDGFKKSIRTQHVEKFSIVSGNATPAPPKNLPPPSSISILKMEEDSWGVWGWGYRAGRRKKKLNHDVILNFSTLRVLMDFLNPCTSARMCPPSSARCRHAFTRQRADEGGHLLFATSPQTALVSVSNSGPAFQISQKSCGQNPGF